MQVSRPVGRAAASRKYDLLTALGAWALGQDKAVQRRALRFITLITARYNWTRDELAVGQREIAALWSVDERTVKREMARLRADGWLVVRRQGVRGRVTEYRLDLARMLNDTRPSWEAVGPDFALRMSGDESGAGGGEVVPLPIRGTVPAPTITDASEWGLAQAVLHAEDPALYAAWVARLARSKRDGGRLTLRAPSRFHAAYVANHLEARLLAACQAVDEDVAEIRVIF